MHKTTTATLPSNIGPLVAFDLQWLRGDIAGISNEPFTLDNHCDLLHTALLSNHKMGLPLSPRLNRAENEVEVDRKPSSNSPEPGANAAPAFLC